MKLKPEPRVVGYLTVYGGRKRWVMAADMYNAACLRASKQFGGRWRFVPEVEGKHIGSWDHDAATGMALIQVGRFKQRRRIKVA